MKNLYFLIIAMVVAFASCNDEEDVIWDISAIEVFFEVEDALGNDLLQNEDVRAELLESVTMKYNGVVYPITMNRYTSRYYLPTFYGIALYKPYDKSNYVISAGEFDGAIQTDRTSFTITWSDGTTDVVSYSNHCTTQGTSINIDRKFYLNGIQMEGNTIKKVLDL